MSLRGSGQDLHDEAQGPSCDGTGRTDGRELKVSFNVLHTLWAFITYILKNCHQHSYVFQNLISVGGGGQNFQI